MTARHKAWPSAALTDADRTAIARTNWRRYPVATVTAMASAWQAGMTSADMARDLGCTHGTVKLLIAKLRQVGVALKPSAWEAAKQAAAPKRSAQAEAMAVEFFGRLRKAAQTDRTAARTLAHFETSR